MAVKMAATHSYELVGSVLPSNGQLPNSGHFTTIYSASKRCPYDIGSYTKGVSYEASYTNYSASKRCPFPGNTLPS